jgi:hypothetical protein
MRDPLAVARQHLLVEERGKPLSPQLRPLGQIKIHNASPVLAAIQPRRK